MNVHLLKWSDISPDISLFVSDISNKDFIDLVESIKESIKEGSTFSQDKAYLIDALAKHNITAIETEIHTLWRFYS